MNDGATTPTRLSRAESRENTHRLLLDAAERVFVRLGYQGATLDGIAAEAGFTKGAVYWHFKNKEALFLELLADGMRQNAGDAEQILTLVAENPESLDDEVGLWIDRFDGRNNVPLLALEMDLESRRNASFAALLDALVVKQQGVLSRIFARYFEVTARDPPMPVEELTQIIIALARGVALARQTQHSPTLTSAKVIRILLGMPVTSRG